MRRTEKNLPLAVTHWRATKKRRGWCPRRYLALCPLGVLGAEVPVEDSQSTSVTDTGLLTLPIPPDSLAVT